MKTQTRSTKCQYSPIDFDDLVVATAPGEKAMPLVLEVAAPDFHRDDDEEDDANRHVRAVEAGDHEEGGAELRRAPRIAPRTHALHDQLGPLERLHADESCAQDGRCDQQPERRLSVLAIADS